MGDVTKVNERESGREGSFLRFGSFCVSHHLDRPLIRVKRSLMT